MSSASPTLGALAFELGQLQNERDLQQLLAQRANELRLPVPLVDLAKLPLPDSALARDCAALAERTLQQSIFLHSMRVYYFGVIVAQDQLPGWKLDPETYFVTSMLHDLGLVRETVCLDVFFFFVSYILSRFWPLPAARKSTQKSGRTWPWITFARARTAPSARRIAALTSGKPSHITTTTTTRSSWRRTLAMWTCVCAHSLHTWMFVAPGVCCGMTTGGR
jgi:hypothetical protein